MTLEEFVREYLLADAVGTGKITPERVLVYRAMYDGNPRGTVALINGLAPGLGPAAAAALDRFASESPYPSELFPELRRRPRAALAAAITHTAEEPPSLPSPVAEAPLPVAGLSDVAGLSEQLFPEVRERRAQRGSRVTWADR